MRRKHLMSYASGRLVQAADYRKQKIDAVDIIISMRMPPLYLAHTLCCLAMQEKYCPLLARKANLGSAH